MHIGKFTSSYVFRESCVHKFKDLPTAGRFNRFAIKWFES